MNYDETKNTFIRNLKVVKYFAESLPNITETNLEVIAKAIFK
jgi:hypothetical protein